MTAFSAPTGRRWKLRDDGAILINSAHVAGRVIARDATVTAFDRSPGRN